MKRGQALPELIQLTKDQADKLRVQQWKRQKRKCAILKKSLDYKDATLDHKHKLKNQISGPNGRGLVRGVLHFQANSLEGAITKKFKRYGLHKLIDIVPFLRNLADYLEHPPMPGKYIHPTEKPKAQVLTKTEYKLVCKHYFTLYPNKKKLPAYPKGRLGKNGRRKPPNKTKLWVNLLEKVYKL